MSRRRLLAGLLFLLAPELRGAVPLDSPSRTATTKPPCLPFVGRWQRIDLAYEKERLVLSKDGRVEVGGQESPVVGRCRVVSARIIQLDLRSADRHHRLLCRWWLDRATLALEVLEARSRGDRSDAFQILDADRSAQGQIWRFSRIE